ncbi:hypothetical protein GCM10010302_13150 [Streptomyces polychromogenes]|uniref:Uncharacterized protein n=1 Tax=Streptomyces polychromogenes TaxID=67342 RepID=A0ABN0V5T7_9ACTN
MPTTQASRATPRVRSLRASHLPAAVRRLGDSLAAQARADEAVAAWTQALVLMGGMTSDRTRKAITSIRSTLAIYQRRLVPGAADLARRAREALA